MSNIGGYQNKESPGRIIWERYKPKSPESSSSDSFRWGRDELFTWGSVSCYWAQGRLTQDQVKFVYKDSTPWTTNIILRAKVELFTRGQLSCCWTPKRDDTGWSEDCIPRCNTLENGHLTERKGWAPYQRVSELLLSPKEGCRTIKWNLYAKVQNADKWASSR